MKRPHTPFPTLERRFKAMMKSLPAEASTIAHSHFVGNFKRQGYFDASGTLIKWKQRSRPQVGKQRSLLIQSGQLRRSLKPMPGILTARVVATADHARLHNRGGKIPITPAMRRFFWAMHLKTKGAFTTKQNSEADFWKSLALAKGPLNIPARPFMTSNPVLLNEIRSHVAANIQTIFKTS